MDEQFQPLDNNEVLFVSRGRVLMPNATFKVSELLDALAQAVSDREEDWSDESEGWFSEGLDCQVLRFSAQGWQRGKVRLRLEFSPETDRPVDRKLPEVRREEVRREEVRREEVRREEVRRPDRESTRSRSDIPLNLERRSPKLADPEADDYDEPDENY